MNKVIQSLVTGQYYAGATYNPYVSKWTSDIRSAIVFNKLNEVYKDALYETKIIKTNEPDAILTIIEII